MLGPFVLDAPLGQGGMAVVWAGHHEALGTPVAVKMMHGPARADGLQLWGREVRSVASLQHPGVVQVLDVGVLPPEVEGLDLSPGAPYLVMERAEGTLQRPRTGLVLRDVLLQLLDALAHAHARGVVHLDLKASNVLVGGERPGLRLSDFGLARAWRTAGPRDAVVRGTPSHMAPEQLDGGALGPWTDLYALGVLAWRMATGEKPYKARNLIQAAAAMMRPLPAFTPELAVPPGFDAWVHTLLQRDPAQRFRRAADAAHALVRLDRAGWSGAGWGVERPARPDAVTLCFAPSEPSLSLQGAATAPTDARGARALRPQVPPLPTHPRSPPPPVPSELSGAGVGLFALRDVGVVGREALQLWLWARLGEVVADRRPRRVVLRGAPGVGTTRLARWLCERSHEVGAGELLMARHGVDPEPGHGIGPMVSSAFHVTGRPYEAVVSALAREGLHPLDARALAAVVQPVGAPALHSPRERVRVVVAGLRVLAAERPLVVWLDDMAHDRDSVALVDALLEAADLPVLVVATGATPEVEGGDVATVGALDDEALRELVGRSLGVSPRVAAAVVARAQGMPLLALQLLHLLVERGELHRSARGLQATQVALQALPVTLAATFRARVQAVAPDALEALQVAGLLGHQVPSAEWALSLGALGLALAETDREALLGAGLLRTAPQGYAFAHDALRAGVAVPDAQRVAWHRVLADVVEGPERRAHHLLRAGDPAAALDPLEAAADALLAVGAGGRAEAVWEARLEALERAGCPVHDDRWGTTWLRLARGRRVRGAWDEARASAEALLHEARRHGWTRYACQALNELAIDRQNAGDLQGARALGREAYELAADEPATRASAALNQALWAIDAGEAELARAMAEETLAVYRAARASTEWNPEIGAGYAHSVLGRLASRAGDHPRAVDHLARATAHFEAAGDRLALADACNYRAGVRVAMEAWDDAEALFREALEHYEAMGVWSAVLVRINLAVLVLQQGRAGEAREPLEVALRQLDAEGREAFAAAVRVFLLPCFLAAGERSRFVAEARVARRGLEVSGFVDQDVARIAARATREAVDRGWDATDVGSIAAAQDARLRGG